MDERKKSFLKRYERVFVPVSVTITGFICIFAYALHLVNTNNMAALTTGMLVFNVSTLILSGILTKREKYAGDFRATTAIFCYVFPVVLTVAYFAYYNFTLKRAPQFWVLLPGIASLIIALVEMPGTDGKKGIKQSNYWEVEDD